ncbi:MAG: ERAP1-like C-terminal domain-containing protein [Acidobacteria bacterium]|nr:ERAP1-like C-terminal domain-containing protein [Acidobacteriota bacterium]
MAVLTLARLGPIFVVGLFVAPLFAAAPSGIPREVAQQRARLISDLSYNLRFTLVPHPSEIAGHEEIEFRLQSAVDLLIDYREGTATKLQINGNDVPVQAENGHILLPQDKLRAGENHLVFDFEALVAPAGRAITRYEDKDDGSEYIYTLFVPMDASMAFPCFDQPDLKARFTLQLEMPPGWTAISNTPAGADGSGRLRFARTEPISTYLFAFAAGPFRKVHETASFPDVYVRKSQYERAVEEAPELQQVTAEGMKFLAGYFAQPFPFPKYDLVLIPGFAYGGMEHAGATFLREESVLFRTAPTHSDRLGRDLLTLHELTHQWFGDFTTMRWFDDLWLKEGFAQYMAYRTLDQLKPAEHVWQRFYLSIKPAAYAIDSTLGTTPIYQHIDNLQNAKSAYGAIVYSKAPGLLRQLAFMVGDEKFRDGLRIYLKEHPYSNAEWSDLVKAFERASNRSLSLWAEAWIHRRGMPQVDVSWSCHSDRLAALALSQHNVLNEGGLWPMALELLLGYRAGSPLRIRAEIKQERTEVTDAIGQPCPAFVFANDQDYAYGRFLLDPVSQPVVRSVLGTTSDLFERTLLWGSLWDSVREAQLAPRDYLLLTHRLLPHEQDEALAQFLSTQTLISLHRYISPQTRAEFVPRFETVASDRMLHAEDQGLRIVWFRTFRAVSETEFGRGGLKQLLASRVQVPGVQLRPLDRWSMVTALVALKDPESDTVLAAERQRDHTGDGLKYAYVAEAARPEAATKEKYFNDYLHDADRPEDWVEQSLGAFNYWNESSLTHPYLGPALEALPQVKRQRKIFFVLAWLGAFIGGQESAEADEEVHNWLNRGKIDPDLSLKVLEAVDELDRTVKIRQRYP